MKRRADSAFEFPEELRHWCRSSEMSHFSFHRERARVAPRGLQLAEIQRLTSCDMCPDGGRGGAPGPRCECSGCVKQFRQSSEGD